ncbi:MAG: zf-HC2 domain-containing protein [Chloroflexi bacterium]|nr:zf-HC2 domain-containing protein [Chloroflexota bacterium]
MVRLFGRAEQRRHELLSAYVDGEVTAEEAREVEELLADSEDARRELAELQATVDLVQLLPELEPPRSFALDAAPKKRWTLWWPSVRTTGLATSVAAMLLVGLVAGDMLNVLEQAQFGGDDSEYASDDSAFALADAPEPAVQESAAAVAMDAPASPEPEVAVMRSVAGQEESAQAPAAPAAAAPSMARIESSEEPAPAAAMQQDTAEAASQTDEAESSEEPPVAMRQAVVEEAPEAMEAPTAQDTAEQAPQAMESQSSEAPEAALQQDMTEQAPEAMEAQSSEAAEAPRQQDTTEQAPLSSQEVQADEVFDDPDFDSVALPLAELQIFAAILAIVLSGATLVAVRRRRRSVL